MRPPFACANIGEFVYVRELHPHVKGKIMVSPSSAFGCGRHSAR